MAGNNYGKLFKSKDRAGIILFDFSKTKKGRVAVSLKRGLWQLRLPWQTLGKLKEYFVEYLELPWQEQEFASLSLEQQQQILRRILLEGKRRGAVMAGMPMNWRMILGNRAPINVADGRDLAIDGLLAEMAGNLGDLRGRQISIIGIEESWNKKVVDKVLALGAKPILTGRQGKRLADYYFNKLGIAIPVLKASKALDLAAGAILLTGIKASQDRDKLFVFKELKVKVAGDWQPPMADGMFPCGLGAALLAMGGQGILPRAEHWQEEPPLAK